MLLTIKMNKKNKVMSAIRIALTTALICNLCVVHAAEPDQIQIEDDSGLIPASGSYNQGVFDLQSEKSTIVSAATEGVKGHYPGIRTIATVNNQDGQVRICSTVTAHYQIIDIDGDWDSAVRNTLVKDGSTEYIHMKTSDTIVWYITDGVSQPVPIPDAMINAGVVSENKLSIKIPAQIDLNDGQGLRSTKGMKLQYKITPWTMIGSVPRTVGEQPGVEFMLEPDALTSGELPVYVDDLSKGKMLEPDSFTGNLANEITSNDIMGEIVKGTFTFPGMPSPTLGSNFITAVVIGDADPADCDGFKPGVKVRILDKNGVDVLEANKPQLWVTNEYRAIIEITDDNGAVRSLTKEELENSEVPFTWNIYYRKGNKSECEFNPLDIKATNDCFVKETFTKGDPRLTIETDPETGKFKQAILKMQKNNNDAKPELQQIAPNYSEQGYFVTVSFGYDDTIK